MSADPPNGRRPPGRLLPLALVVGAIGVVYLAGGLEVLERHSFDTRFRLTERPATSSVVLVDIDTRSLTILEVWPWPRGYHATVLDHLLAAGAARVGFDVDFSSRSEPEEDREFARAVERARGRVVLPVFHQWQRAAGPDRDQLVRIEPLAELKSAAALGSINVRPDPDGIVRRYGGSRHLVDAGVPSFARALRGAGAPAEEGFYVDFGIAAGTIPRISFLDVLANRFDPSAVRDKIVVVGSTAVELGDQIAVPVHAALPGPLLQGLAYESIAQGRELRRLPRGWTLALVLGLALLVGLRVETLTWRKGLAWAGASCGAVGVLAVGLQRWWPLLLDTAPFVLAFAGAYGCALVRRIDVQTLGIVAQRRRARRAERLARHVVEHGFDAVVVVGEDENVRMINSSAQRIFGYSRGEILGRPWQILVEPEGRRPVATLARSAHGPLETVGRRSDGSTFPAELSVATIHAEEPLRVAFVRDITERRAAQRALEHQASHDPLTGLPNRMLFATHARGSLAEAQASGRKAAVLLLDLDGFKEINDTLGHPTGDLLLRQVADRLRSSADAPDRFARLGGDEFAAVLGDTDREAAMRASRSLLATLRVPFDVQDLSLRIDASIGIAMFPDHGDSSETLLQRADVAMYAAKSAHSGIEVYEAERDENSRRHLALKGDLLLAIQNGLLDVAYQPKIRAPEDAMTGVEALARWVHPQHGPIPPSEFIPIAERYGLIGPLTSWVIEAALGQAAAWRRSGRDIGVAVNLSVVNLRERELPEFVERLLEGYGLPGKSLTLEITESTLMADPERSLEVVSRLADLGVGISIDDFGTGYSSLAYLTRLPVREIKIDRSFVMQMLDERGSAVIVRSTIELAHSLGLQVVAEGVESEAVWTELKSLGCDYGQGYHFSRPVPATRLEEWAGRRESQLASPDRG